MPTLNGASGHIDAVLSNFAVMAFNADGEWIGDQLLPAVPVSKQSDLYYVLDSAPFLRDEGAHALRAPRTEAKRVEYSVSTGTYFAPNYALASDFGLEESKNLDTVLRGQQRAMLVVGKLRRAQEVRIANLLTSISNVGSGVALAGTDKWSDYINSDPLGCITTAQAFIQGAAGVVPNTLAIDWNTWKVLRRHPQLLDMFKYTSGGEVTPAQLQSAFDVDRLLVGRSVKENQREGTGTTSKTSIWGNCAILCYVNPGAPSFEEPSTGAVRFQWNDNGIYPGQFGVMRTVYDGAGSTHAETIEAGHFQDEKVVARDMIYTINSTL